MRFYVKPVLCDPIKQVFVANIYPAKKSNLCILDMGDIANKWCPLIVDFGDDVDEGGDR